MMKLTPVNGHLLIEPVKHEAFIASQKETYEEIGIVLKIAWDISTTEPVEVGNKVYFDSWLAAKYPKEGTDVFYWLVKWCDVRAVEEYVGIEYVEQSLSE